MINVRNFPSVPLKCKVVMYWCYVKCNWSRPGFELVSSCLFPTTITITPHFLIHCYSWRSVVRMFLVLEGIQKLSITTRFKLCVHTIIKKKWGVTQGSLLAVLLFSSNQFENSYTCWGCWFFGLKSVTDNKLPRGTPPFWLWRESLNLPCTNLGSVSHSGRRITWHLRYRHHRSCNLRVIMKYIIWPCFFVFF